jgi:hypothetical protein
MCLAKDPDERIQTAHDVRLQLQWVADSSQTGAPEVAGPRRPTGRWAVWAGWAVGVLGLLLALLSFVTTNGRREERVTRTIRRCRFICTSPSTLPTLRTRRRVHAASITALDDQVGRVVAALDRKKMRDDTIVVFQSDNGAPATKNLERMVARDL